MGGKSKELPYLINVLRIFVFFVFKCRWHKWVFGIIRAAERNPMQPIDSAGATNPHSVTFLELHAHTWLHLLVRNPCPMHCNKGQDTHQESKTQYSKSKKETKIETYIPEDKSIRERCWIEGFEWNWRWNLLMLG